MNDIQLGFDILEVGSMPPAAQLVFLYAGCEKLAAIIDGVANGLLIDKVLRSGYHIHLSKLIEHCRKVGIAADTALLAKIFKKDDPASARSWRHLLMHQIGPSHAKKLNAAAVSLVPEMRVFLNYAPGVAVYIAKHGHS